MAFRFKRAACVAVGTFNMYIVQPPWLTKIGILPRDTQVVIASKLDEPGFRFHSPKLPSRWSVSPGRIEVDTEKPDENCGEKVAQVLKELPWTPLIALGNNTVYFAPIGELQSLPDEFRKRPEVPEGYTLAQRSFHFGAAHGMPVFNLQLSITDEEIELSINVHSDFRNLESEVARDAVQSAARRFFQDREDGETLITQLFRVSIQHGDSNTIPA
jgi:hypothetical protein